MSHSECLQVGLMPPPGVMRLPHTKGAMKSSGLRKEECFSRKESAPPEFLEVSHWNSFSKKMGTSHHLPVKFRKSVITRGSKSF